MTVWLNSLSETQAFSFAELRCPPRAVSVLSSADSRNLGDGASEGVPGLIARIRSRLRE